MKSLIPWFLCSALLCGQTLAANDSASPVMLSGPWAPENSHQIDFAALPRVPSEHVIISDVRAKGADPAKLDKKSAA
jgi:hypothetical protein